MSKTIAILAVSLGSTLLTACASWCDDLQDICDRCSNPSFKEACQEAVDEGEEGNCQDSIDLYEDIC